MYISFSPKLYSRRNHLFSVVIQKILLFEVPVKMKAIGIESLLKQVDVYSGRCKYQVAKLTDTVLT